MFIKSLANKLLGNSNERKLKKFWGQIKAINALEPEIQALSDDQLRAKTAEFKDRIAKGATLDSLMNEAFSVVREASKRVLGQRHYDVQLIGGMVLHSGVVAEMKTGEGKTLVATLPSYLNALSGKGVHVVTVNEYLAMRDASIVGKVHEFLGLTVGTIYSDQEASLKKAAYQADITYGTNNEFGFDYLRDNLVYRLEEAVQREHNFAIVDEVDSILIDEARTPLIISGPAEDFSHLYVSMNETVISIAAEYYEVDEKSRSVTLTEDGNEWIEEQLRSAGLLGDSHLYDVENIALVHHLNQSLKAHVLFQKDKDYIVRNDKVVIIDEFTGRMMEGRRYSEGLHQAIEAKEYVAIQPENKTLASITFQNYFRLYNRLSGMTGTGLTEAVELMETYGLDVIEIPTNKPIQRQDSDDEVYRTEAEKITAIVKEIRAARERGQPVLVGTASIEKSEMLSRRLEQEDIAHHVLNARYHQQEAEIIAQAGRLGAVTISTNMAGRGTDIQLGGNAEMRLQREIPEDADELTVKHLSEQIEAEIRIERQQVIDAGGLYVLGTERHESRRIDNQLRGRSGRQGDIGYSKFFLSLQDDLMRIFGTNRLDSLLVKLGLQEGEAIVHPWINKAVLKAQKRVEDRNYEIRKQLIKYDNDINEQRKFIFDYRRKILNKTDYTQNINTLRQNVLAQIIGDTCSEKLYPEQWELGELNERLKDVFHFIPEELPSWIASEGITPDDLKDKLFHYYGQHYAQKRDTWGEPLATDIERSLILQALDFYWREHLTALDGLIRGIGLRSYGQKDPLNEFKMESFKMFETLMKSWQANAISRLMGMQVHFEQDIPEHLIAEEEALLQNAQAVHINPVTGENEAVNHDLTSPFSVSEENETHQTSSDTFEQREDIPRNASCPCGSGLKYKHCHGALVDA